MISELPSGARIVDAVTGEVLEGAALQATIVERADRMNASGVGPGGRVALVCPPSPDFLVNLFAAWRCGASVSCLDPSLTPPEMRILLDFLAPTLIAGASGLETNPGSHAPALEEQALPIDRPALILFTSGTTGRPKGVVLTHRALSARLALNRMVIGEEALRASLVTLPLHFGHGLIGSALTTLAASGSVVLGMDGIGLAAKAGEFIDRFAISFVTSVPAFWAMATKLSRPPEQGTLRRIHAGSAPMPMPLFQRLSQWAGCPIVNCYGMTETANWFSGEVMSADSAPGEVGRPWGGRAAILGADGRLSEHGAGEIIVQSPSLMSGYLDRPDQTGQAFASGWYRTGDTGNIDMDGRITLTGRAKDEINRGGFKVQPADIDRLFEEHPDVMEACAFRVADPISGEVVGIALKLAPGALPDKSAFVEWCAKRLRREAIPERWFFVDDIARNERGKISRARVAASLTEVAS